MTRVIRVLRAVAYAVFPAEVALAVCLVADVRLPSVVWAGAEAALALLFAAEVCLFVRLRRRMGARKAVAELVPEPVLRLVGHELRLMYSVVLWAGRRRSAVGPGDRAFGHARDQAALLFGFAFVCVVETVGMSYLLGDWPLAHAIVLVLDVYSVLFVVGLHAASVTRPHVLTTDALRLRQAAHVDLRIPLDRIASVRHELLFSHEKREGVLDLKVAAQTSLTLELTGPVTAVGLLGRRHEVHTVRCHADDARAFVRALAEALRQVRTAPSPSPAPPA